MIEAVSCGGVVIHRGKILLLYKNQNGKYSGWVLPKGTVEAGETFKDTAVREVIEETGADPSIIKYVNKSNYSFRGETDIVSKTVHWYLMSSNSFYCKPQKEENFVDAGYYKYHEAYHLLKYKDERQILKNAYSDYCKIKNFKRNPKKWIYN